MSVQQPTMEPLIEVTPFGEVNYDDLNEHGYIKSIQDPSEKKLHEAYWEQYKRQLQRFKARASTVKHALQGGAQNSALPNNRIKRYYENFKNKSRNQCDRPSS